LNIDSILVDAAARSWAGKIHDVQQKIDEHVRYLIYLRISRTTRSLR
jgi:hypothetical protein